MNCTVSEELTVIEYFNEKIISEKTELSDGIISAKR